VTVDIKSVAVQPGDAGIGEELTVRTVGIGKVFKIRDQHRPSRPPQSALREFVAAMNQANEEPQANQASARRSKP
jgi:hypothetical protein